MSEREDLDTQAERSGIHIQVQTGSFGGVPIRQLNRSLVQATAFRLELMANQTEEASPSPREPRLDPSRRNLSGVVSQMRQ
jgi:hypothetical protein